MTDTCYNMEDYQNNYDEWNKTGKKEFTVHCFIYIKSQEMKANLQWQSRPQLPKDEAGVGGGSERNY